MQPRPSIDRELLIPIAIAAISILGLAWIFLANYRGGSTIPPTLEPTTIPVDSNSFTTRLPPPPTVAIPTLEETSSTSTETAPGSYPGPPEEAETPSSSNTLIAESQPPASSAQDQNPPFPPGKYDDTHPNIAYDRHWTYRLNSGTKFAYKGTLHTSDSIGNELSFRFTGQRLYLGYQRARSFGTVTVMIDDQTYSFHEQAFGNIWRSPPLSPGTHTVILIHDSGESINLDYIEVL